MAETGDTVLEIPAEDIAVGGSAELEYAGFWSRFAALIVDNAIITILSIVLMMAAISIGAGAAVIANFALILIAFLYWPLMESSERQATFGKQLLGIQVTDANGARLTFVRALLRNLAKIISSLPFGLGFLLAAFTPRRQALHDMITKCLVVRAGPSNFRKAVIAVVGALVISIGGGYYYVTEVYLPQLTQDMGRHMEKGMKQVQKGAPAAKPAPGQPPVAKAPPPAPAPQPAPAAAAPDGPKPMTPQEIADFEKKLGEAKREPEKVAAAKPPVPVAVPEPKPAAPAPAKPAPVPAAKEAAPKMAAAPAATEKPEAKPVAEAKPKPKPKPKPEPKPAAEVPAALVTEPPARPAETPAPAAPAAVVPAPAPAPTLTPARSPRFNDVMTAVMYRDTAAAAELLELGWWVDRPDSNRVTPLMAAAWLGDLPMTQLLLKGGANPTLRSPAGSVLDYAGRGGEPQVIDLLKRSGAR